MLQKESLSRYIVLKKLMHDSIVAVRYGSNDGDFIGMTNLLVNFHLVFEERVHWKHFRTQVGKALF